MSIDNFIDNFVDDLAFSALENWCSIFNIPYEESTDDEYPDWEDELRVKIAEAMQKVGK